MKLAHAAIALYSVVSTVAQAQAPKTPPACTSLQHRQFDFWVGRWDVYPTGGDKLVAHSLIESLYGGCAVRENWMPLSGAGGGSLNSYDPGDGKWHELWVESANARVSFDGGLEEGKMILTGFWKGVNGPGQDGLVRMTYSRLEEGAVRQFGEISSDQGNTWKPLFDFTYKPSK